MKTLKNILDILFIITAGFLALVVMGCFLMIGAIEYVLGRR